MNNKSNMEATQQSDSVKKIWTKPTIEKIIDVKRTAGGENDPSPGGDDVTYSS